MHQEGQATQQMHAQSQQHAYSQQHSVMMNDPADQMDVVQQSPQDVYDQQRMMVPGQPIIHQSVMGEYSHLRT